MGYTVKISDILDLQQRYFLAQHFFQKDLARQNGGLHNGHEVGTLPISIGTGSLQKNLTKANAMGERIVFSKDPPLPTFSSAR